MTNSNFTEAEARWLYSNIDQGDHFWPVKFESSGTGGRTVPDMNWLNSDAAVMPIIRGLERMGYMPSQESNIGDGIYWYRFRSKERKIQYVGAGSDDIAAALRLAVKELIKEKMG